MTKLSSFLSSGFWHVVPRGSSSWDSPEVEVGDMPQLPVYPSQRLLLCPGRVTGVYGGGSGVAEAYTGNYAAFSEQPVGFLPPIL